MRKAFLAVTLAFLATAVRADSLTDWDFSFATPDAAYVGSGSFQTMSLADSIKAGVSMNDGLLITTLSGTMNGMAMTLLSGYGTALDAPSLVFLDHAFNFTVDGIAYFIHDNDTGAPPYGENFHSPTSGYQSVAWTLTDPPPTDTPESSSGMLLLFGLGGIMGLAWDASRKSHDGLLAAGYRGPWVTDAEHPENCKFCAKPLVWYMSKNTRLQPFNADTFEPHHATCEAYRVSRAKEKEAASTAARAANREPGEESTSVSNQ